MLRIAMKQRDRLQYTEKKDKRKKMLSATIHCVAQNGNHICDCCSFSANECNAM